MPQPGEEEFADANWYDWIVIGHENPDKLKNTVIEPLVKAFWDIRDAQDLSDYERREDASEAFVAFMDDYGYTTFEPTKLQWATVA